MSGEQRKEMSEIQNILERANNAEGNNQKLILENAEDQIVSMKRLWRPGSGLIKRRQAEANLWRKGLEFA